MKTFTDYLWFNTSRKREYINITRDVEEILSRSKIKEGMILVSAMHITAGVYVNDAESGLIQDIDEWLEKLAPLKKITGIIEPGKIMAMRILKAFLFITRLLFRLLTGNWILALGSRFIMPNLME